MCYRRLEKKTGESRRRGLAPCLKPKFQLPVTTAHPCKYWTLAGLWDALQHGYSIRLPLRADVKL